MTVTKPSSEPPSPYAPYLVGALAFLLAIAFIFAGIGLGWHVGGKRDEFRALQATVAELEQERIALLYTSIPVCSEPWVSTPVGPMPNVPPAVVKKKPKRHRPPPTRVSTTTPKFSRDSQTSGRTHQ